jgi:hypothetical protein
MTKWQFKQGIKQKKKILTVHKTTDNDREYSLGTTVPNIRMALSNISLYLCQGDIVDLGGLEETLCFADGPYTCYARWKLQPTIVGGIQGLPRN